MVHVKTESVIIMLFYRFLTCNVFPVILEFKMLRLYMCTEAFKKNPQNVRRHLCRLLNMPNTIVSAKTLYMYKNLEACAEKSALLTALQSCINR